MDDIARVILEKYQIRKSRKQKRAFRTFAKEKIEKMGYKYNEEKGMLGAVNIVVGDPTSAKVTYTAHYDTCAIMPFPNFITPTNFGIYLLYQVLITLFLFALAALGVGAFHLAANLVPSSSDVLFWIAPKFGGLIVFSLIFLLLFGPANQHTANDNTSGTITLFEIMEKLPSEMREEVAFIFFDLEESGLFGSAGYASKHSKKSKHMFVVNFDCVSDGNTILFCVE